MIYPNNFEYKIGFDKIRELVKQYCLSTLGEERVDAMAFSDDYEEVLRWQHLVGEFVRIEEEDDFPAENFFDVRESLRRIRIEGLHLDEGEAFDLRRSLETINKILSFFKTDDEEQTAYPALCEMSEDVVSFPNIVAYINNIIDGYGKIKDNASAELLRIRRELSSTQGSISKTLYSILRNAQKEGVVDRDVSPTMREGRLVIPVVPALKRKLKGIVHDESASGKTVFIEPTEVVDANNKIRELESEERREIIRILTELTIYIRPHIEDILESYKYLAEIDFIRAKALFAIEIGGISPVMKDYPILRWYKAKHPLLEHALKKQGKSIVPLDIQLVDEERILIISGPNAGGKSVCLKTVGLLQYMLQSGLMIPLSEDSEAGMFASIFIDIGDEQSLEDDLSTYSSHLTNMKNMMKYTDERSIVLIDEFGGGTEPQIGGAIAEAVLDRFNANKCYGVITTHYQNLKHYAEDNVGVVNGAMLYDRHKMQALFQLEIGNPGSSFAVEIARKIGIPEDVIEKASEIVGREYINADKYLQDIVRDKRYWEKKRQSIRLKEKDMERTIEEYNEEAEKLSKERKSILKQAKADAETILKETNALVENTIRKIKEANAEKERTRKARQELEEYKKSIEALENDNKEDAIKRQMEKLRRKQENKKKRSSKTNNILSEEDIKRKEKEKAEQKAKAEREQQAKIKKGSYVKLKGQTTVGEVMEVTGNNVVVIFGAIKTNVKLNRLELAAEQPKVTATTKSTFLTAQTTDSIYEKKLNFKQEIDVRGMRGDEALQAVMYFVDDAILMGAKQVRILHGTGTGILRTLIRDYLYTVDGVQSYKDEHVQFGGAGITVVILK